MSNYIMSCTKQNEYETILKVLESFKAIRRLSYSEVGFIEGCNRYMCRIRAGKETMAMINQAVTAEIQ